MNEPGTSERKQAPEQAPEHSYAEARMGWAQRRREKIVAEIERNRRGDYQVPTWALVMMLVAFVAAWAAVIALA
ncbi:MAG TPA: hypothetical protein VFM54_16715 [Micromonosporaceae bacterium]|nr:hypothetical protein [Micromonosporaceae bacterium]